MSRLAKLDPNFKPDFDGEKISKELVAKIVQSRKIEQAYLFGSSAEGKNTRDSDLDILLVIPNGENIKNYYQIVSVPNFSPIAVDWIIKTNEEFEKQKDIGGVSRIAFLTGKKIY